jgi:hypothetical protein
MTQVTAKKRENLLRKMLSVQERIEIALSQEIDRLSDVIFKQHQLIIRWKPIVKKYAASLRKKSSRDKIHSDDAVLLSSTKHKRVECKLDSKLQTPQTPQEKSKKTKKMIDSETPKSLKKNSSGRALGSESSSKSLRTPASVNCRARRSTEKGSQPLTPISMLTNVQTLKSAKSPKVSSRSKFAELQSSPGKLLDIELGNKDRGNNAVNSINSKVTTRNNLKTRAKLQAKKLSLKEELNNSVIGSDTVVDFESNLYFGPSSDTSSGILNDSGDRSSGEESISLSELLLDYDRIIDENIGGKEQNGISVKSMHYGSSSRAQEMSAQKDKIHEETCDLLHEELAAEIDKILSISH